MLLQVKRSRCVQGASYLLVIGFLSVLAPVTLSQEAFFNMTDFGTAEVSPVVNVAMLQDLPPLAPVPRTSEPMADGTAAPVNDEREKHHGTSSGSPELRTALLGGITALDGLSADRQAKAASSSADAVLGSEAVFRKTTDSGNLLGKSISVRGVSSQQRTPITTDTRVRAERTGQVLATGSYWAPVRMDLDTMLNKIDSRLIDSLLVVKGPYSPRYGPGFSFIDIEMIGTPRYAGGHQMHGTSSAEYLTNGEQLYGRQTIFGGSDEWGYRLSYGHRTGNDYRDGSGFELPSSYNSRDINVALGRDFGQFKKIEFNYLRLDQTGVEYPGLVFDTRYLVTDGYEVKYFDELPWLGDYHTSEVWYNRTRFEGDTLGVGKNLQIPELRYVLYSPSGFDGYGVTDGDGASLGYRNETIFGELGFDHLALGTDMIILRQGINDREALYDPADNNFPLPPSESVDFGFYAERVVQVTDHVRLNTGARIDTIQTSSTDAVDGYVGFYTEEELQQSFTNWLTYVNGQADLTDHWAATAGFGFGQRPPTLTELYVQSAFIGSLQRGLTYLAGDHELSQETLKQIDLGLLSKYDRFTGGVNWYHAWIDDYITYDLLTPGAGVEGLAAGAGFVNTPLATLTGVETYGQYQAHDQLSFFGILSYVEGTDRTRNETSYLSDPNFDRSGEAGVPVEALPGIPPLDSRLGFLLHDPNQGRHWGMEFSMRAVARQSRVAATLEEIATPGFVTLDVRGYKRIQERWLLTGGVENLTDRFYREHLDYRSGLGVYRPGVGFYSGLELQF